MTTQEQIDLYLKHLPSKWRKDLTAILCEIKEGRNKPSCDDVKECETLTSLSNFTLAGTVVSLKYTDEKGVQVNRTFDVANLLTQSLNGLDPKCLTSKTVWDTLTYQQRIQLIIDSHCACCT